jgi:hypothetical protein
MRHQSNYGLVEFRVEGRWKISEEISPFSGLQYATTLRCTLPEGREDMLHAPANDRLATNPVKPTSWRKQWADPIGDNYATKRRLKMRVAGHMATKSTT